MQRQTLLVSIAVFALLASAIWLFAAQGSAPTPVTRQAIATTPHAVEATVKPPAADPDAPPPAAPPPVAPAVPAPAPAAASDPPAPAAADEPSAEVEAEASADGPAASVVDSGEKADDAVAAPAAAKPDDAAPAVVPASDAADGAAADVATGPDGAASAAGAAVDPPHDDRAVDLFAERIAALEDAQGEDNAGDARAAAAQHAYEERDEGGDAAKAAQASVRDAFATWLSGLSFNGGHPSLIAVDCRSGACRVLVAQAGVDFGGAAQLERESPVNAFTHALADFSQGAAWREAGFELLDSQMTAAGATQAHADDIALWTIYVRVPDAE